MRSLAWRWGLAIVIGTAWANMFPSRAASAVPVDESMLLSFRR